MQEFEKSDLSRGPAPSERIGVFGGTFDPLHHGHVMIALEVHHALTLDRMLLVVANDPWQKSENAVTSASQRLEMTRIGIDAVNERLGATVLEVSDMEMQRGGETYTADTLETLKDEFPEAELFLLVGADAAAGLPTWKRPAKVQELATTVVVERGGRRGDCAPNDWPHIVVDVPAMEISSSDIRTRFADGRPVEGLMPPTVIDAVRRLGLYGATP